MKYLIASDVHGSAYYLNKLLEKFAEEKADRLILLGDIYNHGPRNPLPTEYVPLSVSEMLNAITDKLIVVKGNCDSQVDTLISDFDFINHYCLDIGGKTVLLTHGHIYNEDNLPKTKYNAIIYGHFHTGFIKNKNGVIVANAGSISLPKNDTPSSYVTLEGNNLILKNLNGEIIDKVNI